MRKTLKKLCGVIIAALMLIQLVPVCAGAADNEYIVLHYDNWNIPTGANVSFYTDGLSGTRITDIKALKLNGSDTSHKVTADFYLEEAGNYAVWLYISTGGTASATAGRYPLLRVDGVADSNCASAYFQPDTFAWKKGTDTWSLSAGKHTVDFGLVGGWMPFNIQAIVITDNLSADAYTNFATYDLMLPYMDTTAPAIDASTYYVEYTDATSASVTFPTASDTGGVAKNIYYIDGEAVEPGDAAYNLTNLTPLQEVELKMEAYDKHGNVASFISSYVSSPVQTTGFEITDGTGTIESLEGLDGGDTVSVSANFENITNDEKNPCIYLTLYNADFTRVIENAEGAQVSADGPYSASITLPDDFAPDKYALALTLCDADTLEPYITGIEIGQGVN